MASSSKLIFIFLLLIASSFSIEIQARQFFNKVSSAAELEEPRKQQQPSPEQQQQQAQDPSFYAQTSESSSYGLYGAARDSDHSQQQLTPTTATTSTYKPYVTPVRYHPDEPFNAIPNNNNQNLQESRFGERSTFYNSMNNNEEDDVDDGENSTTTDATYGNNYGGSGKLQQQQQNNNNNFEDEAILFQERNSNSNNNNGEGSEVVMRSERQGMSDTRFLGKGKYYHDINSEISNSGADKYPQSGGSDASHVIYNNNGYGNLQGRRNTNYNSNLQNQEEFQQFHDQP